MRSAEPGTVLVSEATRPFLERRFVVSPFAVDDGVAGRAYRLAGLGRTALGLGEQLTPLVAGTVSWSSLSWRSSMSERAAVRS